MISRPDPCSAPAHLFFFFSLREVTLKNRIALSPMCQHSAQDGMANDWHLVHYGALALGGAGLLLAEATAVAPEGRISPQDLGVWKDEQVEPLARVVHFARELGQEVDRPVQYLRG